MSGTAPKFEKTDIHSVLMGVDLPALIARQGIKLTKRGREYVGCCPFHAEKSPSFTVYEEKGRDRYKCFGCGAGGDALSFLEKYLHVSTGEALGMLTGKANLPVMRAANLPPRQTIEVNASLEERKLGFARQIWHEAIPQHPVLQAYFKARRLTMNVPITLRLHEACLHAPSQQKLPAMIAPIQSCDGQFMGVHRTYLKPDGSGKAAVEPAKMMLGVARGGTIRLGPLRENMVIGEGIETVCSVLPKLPEYSGLTFLSLNNLANLHLPANVQNIVLLADADMKQDMSGFYRDQAGRLQMACARRRVRIAWPVAGSDFNDMLMTEGS